MTVSSTSEPKLDDDALGSWFDTQDLPGAGEAIEQRVLSGGTQNEIFEIRRGDLRGVVRKPPAGAPPARDKGILREWRIIKALDGTDVPHPRAIAVCSDSSVLGRPFYVMGHVDGWSPMSVKGWAAPFDADVGARRGLAFELIDGIVRLGKVDWRVAGLHDYGRPDAFHERQVERWTTFYDRIKGREVPGLHVATQWLASHRPIDFVPGIMHGDYQFANVMFGHGAPARLAAIIDWEMATVGDPKLDLAWALRAWPEDTTVGRPRTSDVEITGMPGFSELLACYAEHSGRQVDDFDYYLILARWKLAIVLEGGYQRAGDDPNLLGFGDKVIDLMRCAAELAETTDYRQVASR
jgi:aminoglycoside phosphotransferase (APT) family kinase protein